MGTIRTICISEKKGTAKTPVEGSVRLIEGFGIEGDAHAGRWHRQISLLSYESIRDFKARGAQVRDGSFGENLITEGIDLSKLSVGTLLRAGESLLRVCLLYTSIIKPRSILHCKNGTSKQNWGEIYDHEGKRRLFR